MNAELRGDGRVALVTGAAAGLGRGVAAAFATAGYRLALVDFDEPEVRAAAAELCAAGADARAYVADVAAGDQVAAVFDRIAGDFARLDFVFHSAGILGPEAKIEDADDAAVARVFDVDLKGAFYVLKYAVRTLKRFGGGAVVTVGSIAAEHGSTFYPAYCAAKAGLTGLVRSVARSAGRANVRVNCLSPGSILGTRLSDPVRGRPATPQERQRLATALMHKIPVGRAARADDVAQVALFLASPAAHHVHGVVLTVDGGECLGYEGSPVWRHAGPPPAPPPDPRGPDHADPRT